ncbi:MAG TPA: UDP-N-acetylmuramoyl-tripeptide--D-alanyl-D-alanine ligase, partial [Rhodanobacteraceae bacterium]|nr:UDP-N-acetylmuramoyl-tripeptide--D-alanyl-D-alanine ligase [Rhodanobacteraceae bacterium]
MKLRLTDIATWVGGRLHGAGGFIDGVSTDTRTLSPGSLFVALKGERYDAHDFVGTARERGATAALVDHIVDADMPQIIVADTLAALGELARAVRSQRDAWVIGITGSNGKTTVKTLTASILGRHGRTHFNTGNLNNEIGVPLTLLAMPEHVQYAVIEMGAGKPDDIAYLARIARPDVGLVNNVASAHLERLGSERGVAETKGAIYAALPDDGIAIVNADDAYAGYFFELAGKRRVVRFGLNAESE